MKHSDYITHINNTEDQIYLKSKHFPVNMRLFKTSPEYKQLIRYHCDYIRMLCLQVKEGYKKPHGMSSANAGLAFNIIGITRFRGQPSEYCQIMINPVITYKSKQKEQTLSNCGSITLKIPIKVPRYSEIEIEYYDEHGAHRKELYNRKNQGFTIQHEVDHNLGILITDY